MSENAKQILSYLKHLNGAAVTTRDLVLPLNLEEETIKKIFYNEIFKAGLGTYQNNNKHSTFLVLTAEGMAYKIK